MNTATAELIDIDFLWMLIEESYDDHQDGDVITFHHPRRGRLTALQSGRTAMLTEGGFNDRRGLSAISSVLAFDIAADAAPIPLPESSAVVIPFPTTKRDFTW